MEQESPLKVGELSALASVGVQTLHYYERLGTAAESRTHRLELPALSAIGGATGLWNKMVLWLATSVVLIMVAFPSISSAIQRTTQSSVHVAVAEGNGVVSC